MSKVPPQLIKFTSISSTKKILVDKVPYDNMSFFVACSQRLWINGDKDINGRSFSPLDLRDLCKIPLTSDSLNLIPSSHHDYEKLMNGEYEQIAQNMLNQFYIRAIENMCQHLMIEIRVYSVIQTELYTGIFKPSLIINSIPNPHCVIQIASFIDNHYELIVSQIHDIPRVILPMRNNFVLNTFRVRREQREHKTIDNQEQVRYAAIRNHHAITNTHAADEYCHENHVNTQQYLHSECQGTPRSYVHCISNQEYNYQHKIMLGESIENVLKLLHTKYAILENLKKTLADEKYATSLVDPRDTKFTPDIIAEKNINIDESITHNASEMQKLSGVIEFLEMTKIEQHS